jgi:two-component system CheB/CheR fusion protein
MTTDQPFPIVGIGASAGGLRALEGLFHGLPADAGMAFLIVTHLASGKESTLPAIIGRYTAMPVAVAAADTRLEPDHVYVCPPDTQLTVKQRRIQLAPFEQVLQRFPIDRFLISLAEDAGEGAIGVLLSGGGSDGTLGITAIKDHGGLTLAQGRDGSGPAQSSMPDTAIAAGVVDLVLTVEEMGPRLASFARSFAGLDAALPGAVAGDGDDTTNKAVEEVHALLLNQTGHDFSGYKPKTFMRRVRRRMQVLQLTGLDDYVARLREDADEPQLLFRDLLIGVTSFFRDPAAFEALERLVIPRLFEGKTADDALRVWVPGCATGEEAYSIAILLREHMDATRAAPNVQIFATDIDDAAMLYARTGRYQPSVTTNISQERLQRFFTANDAGYSISKDIRDMCVFSVHDVLRDPPFSRLDLVSCRNLLIYFNTEFQARVLPIFHFALRPGGYLMLGTSESVSRHADLFAPLDKKQRIFQRRDQVAAPLRLPQFAPSHPAAPAALGARSEMGTLLTSLRNLVEARVVEQFAPAHVVVNREGDVLYYSARTGKYLEPPAGLPNRQLLALARRGLRIHLRAAFRETLETRRAVRCERLSFDVDGRSQAINLVIEPFGDNEQDPLFLVLFQDLPEPAPAIPAEAGESAGSDKALERLEQDLRETRERLQLTIEEYETAVEELKSSNEELQSINEELQSSNEELETSKEELQSVNEELNTVNAELSAKVEELDRANSDLRNVFESTQVALVFLDRNLVIRSFTPAATAIFQLISSDRGRPLTDIVCNLSDGADLRRDIHTVFEQGAAIERRVHHNDGVRHYFMRILPYRGEIGVVQGAIVTLLEVTRLVEAEARERLLLQDLNGRARRVLEFISDATEATRRKDSSGKPSQALLGRVRSLARCYDLLARAQWGEVALRDLAEVVLGGYRTGSADRIVIDGPPAPIKAAAALALAMALHELISNAARHGALSTGKGRIAVTWSIAGGRVLNMEWRESGGPRRAKSRRTGLGTELVERDIAGMLRATIAMDYRIAGLQVRISMPLDNGRDVASS